KIAEYERQMSELGDNISNEKAFQEALSEQISLIQENISLLNQELDKLSSDITRTDENIRFLDYSITERQKQIDESIELFKKRLCTMYMTGSNDNLISVLFGSSSFYDMMTRVKVVNNMAEYDEQLINNILNDIDSLEKDRKDLEAEKQSLEAKLSEQETKKAEKTNEIQSLNEKMSQSQTVIEQINAQQAKVQRSKDDAESLLNDLDRQEIEIQEEIRRKAEEAQKRYEEEQRRKQEELRRQQEELLRQQQEQLQKEEQDKLYQQWLEQQVPPQNESVPITSPSKQPYIWPVPNFYYVISGYGERDGLQHKGIDISDADINGATICAARDGIVISVNNSCEHNYGKPEGSCGCGGDFGNYVIISHDGTYSTVYAHMSYVSVSAGDYVEQGQVIGAVGSTGWSTGPHLHFELRVDGYAENPLDYVSP
ncbi:MAG: peptidoglycan DD-metalloendopeptidase family protein, partial [Ruminococcus sp.]|nr:peptidoglycan DD-metalloendopeptidase family protein [Ruminococcus sp.]